MSKWLFGLVGTSSIVTFVLTLNVSYSDFTEFVGGRKEFWSMGLEARTFIAFTVMSVLSGILWLVSWRLYKTWGCHRYDK